MIEITERQVELQEETEKLKQSDKFVNTTLQAAVMSNYVITQSRVSFPFNPASELFLNICSCIPYDI